jgi:hypothetical protein
MAFDSVTSSIGEQPFHTTTHIRLFACLWSHVVGTMQNSLTLVSINPSATESTVLYISFSRTRFCHRRVHFGSCPHTSPSLLLRFVALIIKRLVSNERALVINLLTDQPPANFEDTLLQVIRLPCCAILVRYLSFGICLWLCVLRLAPLRALHLLQVVISGCLMLGIQCLAFYTAFSFTPTWKIKCIRITFLARCH